MKAIMGLYYRPDFGSLILLFVYSTALTLKIEFGSEEEEPLTAHTTNSLCKSLLIFFLFSKLLIISRLNAFVYGGTLGVCLWKSMKAHQPIIGYCQGMHKSWRTQLIMIYDG